MRKRKLNTGIYQIRNITNDNLYIGSASSLLGFDRRWYMHQYQLERDSHHSAYLQHAWNKYGADVFVFEILLYCDSKDCLIYEQIALDCYKPQYNICKVAGSRLGVSTSNKTKKKLRTIRLGYKMSDKSKQKVSLARRRRGLDYYNNKFTASTVNQIEELLKNNISQKQIAQQFQMSQSTVSDINTGKHWSQR